MLACHHACLFFSVYIFSRPSGLRASVRSHLRPWDVLCLSLYEEGSVSACCLPSLFSRHRGIYLHLWPPHNIFCLVFRPLCPFPIPYSVLCASPPCCVALPLSGPFSPATLLCPGSVPGPITARLYTPFRLRQFPQGASSFPCPLLSRPVRPPHQTANEGPVNLIRSRLARFASLPLPFFPSSLPPSALPSPAHPGLLLCP